KLNDLFGAEVGEDDQLHWVRGIADRVARQADVMQQIRKYPSEQVMQGPFLARLQDILLDTMQENESLTLQALADEPKTRRLGALVLELLARRQGGSTRPDSPPV